MRMLQNSFSENSNSLLLESQKNRRTKIVATLGPASNSPEIIRELIQAGMDVARLNFSHGTHETHAQTISNLRMISAELDTPVTIMQDLQGPKIRVGNLPHGRIVLKTDSIIDVIPEQAFDKNSLAIPIDYSGVAKDAKPGMQILLADGLIELKVLEVKGDTVRCHVTEGGILESRKGVNFPNVDLQIPSLTEKDIEDVEFGIEHEIDWISLSFVRNASDIRALKNLFALKGTSKRVIAKIEKSQAINNLKAIMDEADGIMVARGDLGVEMSPEKVPMLQKYIIESCNRRGLPVITATQMLESMVHHPHPTRAEASDVANAIIDGTDALMLSAESAVGAFPVRAVGVMAKIAREVESSIEFKTYKRSKSPVPSAISQAAITIAQQLDPKFIIVLTTTGETAHSVAAERPKPPVVAITIDPRAYHALNLFWGIKPLLVSEIPGDFESMTELAERTLRSRGALNRGDAIIIIGGIPAGQPLGTNFIKIHSIS